MVLIIGGGITGLAAAYELTQRAVPFVLLEASGRAGGLIRTEHVGGFTIEAGPDSLLVQKPAAIRLCEALGLGPRLISTTPPRTAFILARGRLHALPSPSVLGIPTSLPSLYGYDLLTWRARARLLLEPLMPRGPYADESVARFFARRFGRATVDLVAEPLLGGIHAGHIDELSMGSLFPTLVQAERQPGKVLLTLRRRRPDPGGAFRALRSGMGELVDGIVASLPPGSLRLHTPVRTLEQATAGWRVTAGAGRGLKLPPDGAWDRGSETVDAAAVIVAAPAHAAAAMLAHVDPAAARLWSTVPYVSTASVALGWRRRDVPHPLAGSGFVVARRGSALRITACTWVSSKWEGRAPDGHALLRVFLGGAHDPGVVELSDEAIIEMAVRDLSATLGITAPPVLARVYRWPQAGAQHTVGHRARMSSIAQRLRERPGLFAAGSGFESIGIPDCIADGRRAAAAAADYTESRR